MRKLILCATALCLMTMFSFSQNHHCQSKKKFLKKMGGAMLDDPGNLRSDTIDVIHYDIDLDMTNMNNGFISGHCTVDISSKMNGIDWLTLDLRALVVDSVTSASGSLVFSHVDETLIIQLPLILDEGDEYSVIVHYHGLPQQDATWGGFYFQSGYAYNLGVAFTSEPHNFGRAWFPCFDNFVERSSFSFHVLTNQNRTAYCNGNRISVESMGQDSLLTHWQLLEEIPSYLACVAASNYVQSENSFQSVSGQEIPIWLISKAVDSTDMKLSMVNLPLWMESVETKYGPYRWPKVGYCAVPFSGGAMEHATNISYPLFACDGTLDYETLYAHEVSHHWWGDLVTCRNAYDMWLNEGWASYSEALFEELIYGADAYTNYVRANHKDVLLYAHKRDGGRYAVSGVPSEITYGDHVYNKGADVAHTLRGYMGSEDFFNAIPQFMEAYQFRDISSQDLRDFMQSNSSADILSFFNNWVFEPGFPEFRVTDFQANSSTEYQVSIEQHKHYSTDFYANVPMQLTAMNEAGLKQTVQVNLSGENSVVTMTLPDSFDPVFFYLNENDAISQAVLAEERYISDLGTNDFDYAEMDLDLNSLGTADSVFVRIENHWAAVDEAQTQIEYFISPDRWWNVFISPNAPDADLSATIRYYGNDGQSNYFDPLFFDYLETNGFNEDSLVLLYRENSLSTWQVCPSYSLFTIPGLTNWTGWFEIQNLQTGQYAWAVRTGLVDVQKLSNSPVSIFSSFKKITIESGNMKGEIRVTDMNGKVIASELSQGRLVLDASGWSEGVYFVQWKDRDRDIIFREKVFVGK